MKRKFKNLLLEPYRLFFGSGSLYAVVSVGYWFAWFWGLEHQKGFGHWSLGPPQVHSHVMIFGVIGSYVFGFLMTAYPRWVNEPLPAPRTVVGLWLIFLISQILFLVGALGVPSLMAFGSGLEALSYGGLFLFLLRKARTVKGFKNNPQPFFVLLSVFFAAVAVFVFFLFSAFEKPLIYYQTHLELGTYGFLLLLVVSVTYRIVPFFTSRVVANYIPQKGKYALEAVLILILLHLSVPFLILNLKIQYYLLWSLDLLLFIILSVEWFRWKPAGWNHPSILMILYLAFSWVLVFLGFSIFEMAYHLLHPKAPVFPLYHTAALHALYVGGFATLLLGISTRVVRGHGGYPLKADTAAILSWGLIQIAAWMRVLFPLLSERFPYLAGQNYWAGLFWCLAFLIWAFRYIPFLFSAPPPTQP